MIALVVTPDGFPLAYEVMNGNTSDRATLRAFLDDIEKTYGKAKRTWVMDRGIPSEAILKEMREPERETFYLVGTPKGKINQHEKKWLDLPWQKVRDSVQVKLYQHERRTLRVGQERRQAGERNRHPAQTSGTAAAQTARDAQELAQTRSTAATNRSGQERSRPGVRVREDSAFRKLARLSRVRRSRFSRTRPSSRPRNNAMAIICCDPI